MDLKGRLRRIPNHPRPGITFIDITPLLKDPLALREAVAGMAALVEDVQPDLVVAPEARGFLVGAPLAVALGAGFAPVRKAGKLPYVTVGTRYTLEYGSDRVEMHADAVRPGQRVLVVDDLLATGGTAKASIQLVEQLGGKVVAAAFLVELEDLGARQGHLRSYPVRSLLRLREGEEEG